MSLEQNATTDTLENDMHPYVRSQISRYVEDFRQFTTLQFSNRVIGSQVKGDLNTILFLCESHNLNFKPYKLKYINGIKKYLGKDN
jgi:hypothetical protein|tara:strand:- start:278 stop:535 length:258 start_codon:yes stop_codon:yes gene_type:complete